MFSLASFLIVPVAVLLLCLSMFCIHPVLAEKKSSVSFLRQSNSNSKNKINNIGNNYGDGRGKKRRRRLEEFSIPYSITWNIGIGSDGMDGQPTDQDYDNVVTATIDWFRTTTEQIYGNTATGTGLSLVDITATLVPEETLWNSNETAFQHVVEIDVEAIFEANDINDVPTSVVFLVDLNQESNVIDFITNHLFPTVSDDSVFQFTQRVSYATRTRGATEPSDGSGGGGGGGGGGEEEGDQSAPTATLPAPALSTLVESDTSFSNTYILPLALEFNVGVGTSVQDRQPSAQEYEGFAEAVNKWMFDSLSTVYMGDSEFRLAEVTSDITGTTWDASLERGVRHKIELDTFVHFNANSLRDVPGLAAFFATLRTDDISLQEFLATYLRGVQPSDSLFRSTNTAQYNARQNGPRVPADSNTPSPPAPTPTPITATASPVASNQILSSTTVPSTWTYTVGGDFAPADFDRQPTQAEYEGMAYVTNLWMSKIMNDHYNVQVSGAEDENLAQFVQVETSLVNGAYEPNAERPHVVDYEFVFTFAVDEDDESQVIPFVDDIFDVVRESDLNVYTLLYVHRAPPSDSVFHGVNSVAWSYDVVDDYTYVPRPTRAPTPNSGTDGLGSSTEVSRQDFQGAQGTPVELGMYYGLNTPLSRAASTAEWTGLAESTRQFWIDTLTAHFASQPDVDFVIVDAKWKADTTSFTSGDEYPYSGRFITEVLFVEGSTVIGTVDMRQIMVRLLSNSNYITDYLRQTMPVDSLFRDTVQIRFEF